MSTAPSGSPDNTSPNLAAEQPGPPPEAALTQMILGALASQAVYVVSKLGISDLLAGGPKTVEELATATKVHAPSLYRIMRALASFGVYTEGEDKTFALNPMADLLRADSPGSLRDVSIFMGEDWHWNVWAKTMHSVQTGKPAWPQVHGQEVFPYLESNKEASAVFDKAMTSFSNLASKAVVSAYNFAGIETLVDIAGGQGRLLVSILEANPSLRGILFDQAHVIAGAKEVLANTSVAERLEVVSGDFFKNVPSADAYIMKHIIHDWDDERAVAILKTIKQSMKAGGRVLLVESVLEAGSKHDFGKLLDIEMLVSPGGMERTADEYAALFAASGLSLKGITRTQSPYSVIEAG